MNQNPLRWFAMPDDPIEIIGGDTVNIPYSITDEDGTPVDITSATIVWTLAEFEAPETAVVTKSTANQGEIIFRGNTGEFFVQLLPADTQSKHGLFIYQITVTVSGVVYRRIQGLMYIWAKSV